MALYDCENINKDFCVIINNPLSNKYPTSKFYISKGLIPMIITNFFKDLGLKISNPKFLQCK